MKRFLTSMWIGVLLTLGLIMFLWWADVRGKLHAPDTVQSRPAVTFYDNDSGDVNAYAVIGGLTHVDPSAYGGWNGACPGCDVDASTFAVMCKSNRVSYSLLMDEQCTFGTMLNACKYAVSRLKEDGLLILYLSGHGGQVTDTHDASELDRKSETLCLYDGQLVDNKVWELLNTLPPELRLRVWMITDSCNSGTNYRGVHDYTKGLVLRREQLPFTLLHWGGCADGKSSMGSEQGGTFTTAFVDAYVQQDTYGAHAKRIDRLMPITQRPTFVNVGGDFSNRPLFR